MQSRLGRSPLPLSGYLGLNCRQGIRMDGTHSMDKVRPARVETAVCMERWKSVHHGTTPRISWYSESAHMHHHTQRACPRRRCHTSARRLRCTWTAIPSPSLHVTVAGACYGAGGRRARAMALAQPALIVVRDNKPNNSRLDQLDPRSSVCSQTIANRRRKKTSTMDRRQITYAMNRFLEL